MNTTPRAEPQAFDSFDEALVGELRRVVVERNTSVVRRTRRRPAAIAASVAVVTGGAFGISTLGTSAAYAVDRTASGDIQISIHRLDDAAGLEQKLASYGIDATVDYQAATTSPDGPVGTPSLALGDGPKGSHEVDPGAGPTLSSSSGTVQAGTSRAGIPQAGTDQAGIPPKASACGGPDNLPLTTELRSDDYVITIPQGSALMKADSQLQITTSGNVTDSVAGLTVDFTIDGTQCGFGTMTASTGSATP